MECINIGSTKITSTSDSPSYIYLYIPSHRTNVLISQISDQRRYARFFDLNHRSSFENVFHPPINMKNINFENKIESYPTESLKSLPELPRIWSKGLFREGGISTTNRVPDKRKRVSGRPDISILLQHRAPRPTHAHTRFSLVPRKLSRRGIHGYGSG